MPSFNSLNGYGLDDAREAKAACAAACFNSLNGYGLDDSATRPEPGCWMFQQPERLWAG
ncbi:hypothetical protein THIOKS1880004 [Thiocapsa sp. KS1]|nr:hypothetical protein THIOKS1880004 [Thiocapsa sp. KS1]